MRTRSAHPVSRPLPFRSLQELRRHLNCCFQLIYFYHNFWFNAIPPPEGFRPAPRVSMITAIYPSTGGASALLFVKAAGIVTALYYGWASCRLTLKQLLKPSGSCVTKNASIPKAPPPESRGHMTTASK